MQNEPCAKSPGERKFGISPAEPTGCLLDVEQGSWQWFRFRETIPTGSKAYDYCVKRRSSGKGGNFPKEARDAMEHGKKWESTALAKYEENLPVGVSVEDGKMWLHRNVGASPDGITTDGVIVEIKCPYWRSVRAETMPITAWWQVQAEMEATGLAEADFVEMDFNGDLTIKRVFKHPDVSAYMQEQFSKERVRRAMVARAKVDD